MTGEADRPLALVTGGMQRIGAAIAAALARAGYDLALHKRSPADPDPVLAAALVETGVTHHRFRHDLSEAGAGEALFDAVVATCGRPPHVIVNNASHFADTALDTLNSGDLAATLAVNLVVPVMLTQQLLASGAGGVVVNIVDQRVLNPVPDQFAYTLSKQALWQATRSMAVAAAPKVRVNAVAPGLTLPTDDYAPGQMQRLAGAMPLGMLPNPDQIAAAVMYLVGAEAVTGQTIFVDGGANLKSYDRDFVAM
jgi:NAD(P)-dependent dehydrogenase (short-subunit alcohol dehydrogenase family)